MTDFHPRVTITRASNGAPVGTALDTVFNEFSSAAVKGFSMDPVIFELVRLRCAQVHDCRFCSSVRFDQAVAKGFDEDMNAKIARYETSDLGDAAIAALRLVDSIIMAPAVVADEQLTQELRRHFTPKQIAELCFVVMRWSQQKVDVSLRTEPPAPEISLLSISEAGQPSVSGAAYR